MIRGFRIDERLIHGQVAVAWCTSLGVDSIVIADDETVNDDVAIFSLKMAAPTGVKVVIKSVNDAIPLLNDPRISTKQVLVLVRKAHAALTLLENVTNLPDVNVGNFGMIESGKGRKILDTSFAVSIEENEAFKKIIELCPNSYYQMTPTLTPKKISELILK